MNEWVPIMEPIPVQNIDEPEPKPTINNFVLFLYVIFVKNISSIFLFQK